MKLKGLDFKSYVFDQSGAEGFFGEGDEYRHHPFFKHIPGFSFKGISFVAKTVTLKPRLYSKTPSLETANTKLRDEYKMAELFPNSVWWSPWSLLKGYFVNAVGMPNPGLSRMLDFNKWQRRKDAFQISISLMEQTTLARIAEAEKVCVFLNDKIPYGKRHRYAIQLNESCPNTGHDQMQGVERIIQTLEVFRNQLPEVLIIVKFDPLISAHTVVSLKNHCDGFCIGNTIMVGREDAPFSWNKFFKGGVSPLVKIFGKKFPGGISGAPLFPVLVKCLTAIEQLDDEIVVIAGGGIMRKKHIDRLAQFKIVHGIALGSVALARPFRLQTLIKHGNAVFAARAKEQKV